MNNAFGAFRAFRRLNGLLFQRSGKDDSGFYISALMQKMNKDK